MRCQTGQAIGLTSARADHRCIFRVEACKHVAAAIILAGLISIAVPVWLPLSKDRSPYCQYGISIPQLPTDHLCFSDVPEVGTETLPLTTAVHVHTAFVLGCAANKTNIGVAYMVWREQRAQLPLKFNFRCTVAV